ncbi:MAG TPA: S41 family peptidase [Vicinamibacterales bacterium]|nr:S41 family peptidase [Vicinamibacterales bacterium]
MRPNTLLASLSQRLVAVMLVSCLIPASAAAQLTQDQKIHDFENLAGNYAKRYAPYEWKKQLFGFDLFDLRPWLTRIRHSQDDLSFFEIMLEYVASLQDTHSQFSMPSSFVANLGFTVDIYDGRVMIDSINRTRLPLALYPFQLGDVLVSMDDRTSEEWIKYFSRFSAHSNPLATKRDAASFLTVRPQSNVPRVIDLPDNAVVVIERAGGSRETYVIPWQKTGVPLRWIGAVPTPGTSGKKKSLLATESPSYYDAWQELTNFALPQNHHLLALDSTDNPSDTPLRRYVLGLGGRNPVFRAGLPANFVQRLGQLPSHSHFSGIYEAGGLRIGVLRFPNFAPPPTATAELQAEIAFLEQNTDALVVDVMRNPGGGCYMLTAASYLIPYPFFFFGEEIRVTISRINLVNAQLEAARNAGDTALVEIYTAILEELERAYRQGRALTNPVPACSTQLHGNQPAKDAQGNVIAYTKPLILLVDEFTISAGDIFSAMLQDNRRGALVGTRTNGGGGSVSGLQAGTYSESTATNTNTLVTRIAPVTVPGYPEAHYVENIGAHADIRLDYMTRENLLTNGRPFVDAFTAIVAEQVRTASECRYAGPAVCAPPGATTSSTSSSSAPPPAADPEAATPIAATGAAFETPQAPARRTSDGGSVMTGRVAQKR